MDGIIDIIIAVLFIAIPTIFKAIGNKLEKSGKAEKAGKFKRIAEAMNDDDKSVLDEIETPVLDEILEKRRIEVCGEEDVVSQIKTAKRKPILLEEEPEKKRTEKIDPKKLVIYSEIMKQKF